MSNLTSTDAIVVELYDNPLTEREDDCYGRAIHLASVDEDVLIKRAISNGYNGNAETMKSNYLAMEKEALQAVARSEITKFGLGYAEIIPLGPFSSNAPLWNSEVNSLVPRISPIKKLRDMMKNIPVRVIGLAPDKSAISTVTDVASGKTNVCLTPGGMANIKGSRIRIAGDKPGIGLFLANQDTQTTVQVPVNSIGVNDPSNVIFVIPTDLEAGNYLLSIVTQTGSNNKQLLANPKTILLNILLTVE
jgi:hypothetical protein